MPLPADKRPALDRALMAAFGTTAIDAARPVSGGLSGARLYRIAVDGGDYLLRIEGPPDAFRDPIRGHACMRIAAEAGLAPRVRHAAPEDGVAIMDFITERPPAVPRAAVIGQLARATRALHDGPAFPPLIDYLDGLALLVGQALSAGLAPAGTVRGARSALAALIEAWRRLEPDLVSSHNDLNPRNILHDGQRPWLIDWESAFPADRYVDLAALANLYASDPADEARLLEAYFDAPVREDRSARLFLARQLSHLFYGAMFLNGAAAQRPGQAPVATDGDARSLATLHAALAAGQPVLDAWEGRVRYGLARLEAAIDGVEASRFARAVRLAR